MFNVLFLTGKDFKVRFCLFLRVYFFYMVSALRFLITIFYYQLYSGSKVLNNTFVITCQHVN